MANWQYTINVKPIWEKYENLSENDFDNDEDIFNEMKKELTDGVKKQMRPADAKNAKAILDSLKNAQHIYHFNNYWSQLYDFCDTYKIWLKTSF